MNADIAEIQRAIRNSGVPGTSLERFGVDGQWGAEGRAALSALITAAGGQIFQLELTEADYAHAARMLGCTVPQIKAIFEVEAAGSGWFTDIRADILALDGPGGFIDGANLPKILFEAHHFSRLTGGKFDKSHPNISSRKWNRALYVGGQGEYARLNTAMMLNRNAALQSASWGAPQIMGFNYRLAGFNSVESFVEAMKSGAQAHLMAFVSFVANSGLRDAVRQIDNNPENARAFARGYNGAAYAKNDYHGKIARAFTRWRRA